MVHPGLPGGIPVKKTLIVLSLYLVLASLSVAAQDVTSPSPSPGDPGSSSTTVGYCKGEYTNHPPGSTDIWITVECPSITSPCSCNAAGVTCGSNSSPVDGLTYVDKSCQSFTATSSSSSSSSF
jgi:hypothetical protein